MQEYPHYLAHEAFTECEGIADDPVKGPNIVTKLKNSPGKIWISAPHYGEDNENILEEQKGNN